MSALMVVRMIDVTTEAWNLAIQDIIDAVRKDPSKQEKTPNPAGKKLKLTFIVGFAPAMNLSSRTKKYTWSIG